MIPNDAIDELASRILRRREGGSEAWRGPYLLFLGDGCARAAGIHTPDLARRGLEMLGTVAGGDDDACVEHFEGTLASLEPSDAGLLLESLFASIAVPAFYQQLAQLVLERFFPIILTTNFDTLLEQALDGVGVKLGDYRVTTFSDRYPISTSTGGSEMVHIIKLHGDVASKVVHFTPDSVQEALGSSRSFIKSELSGDMILAAHRIDDDPINQWLGHRRDRELWWVNAEPPNDFQRFETFGAERNEIVGDVGDLNNFFFQLALRLQRTDRVRPRRKRSVEQPGIVRLVDSIRDRVRSSQIVGGSVRDYLDQHADALRRELSSPTPDLYAVSASLGATISLTQRLHDEFGASVVDLTEIEQLRSFDKGSF